MPTKAILLDRDGVIIRKAPEGEYIADWEAVEFLPGSLESVSRLYRSGFKIIIVTNQRGVATGKIDLQKLEEIHRRMKEVLAREGVVVSGIYYCPHDLPDRCRCRKPQPGMLLRAATEHQLDLSACWMVGDEPKDVEAGKQAGCKTVLLRFSAAAVSPSAVADIVAEDLKSAAQEILLREITPGAVVGSGA